MKLKAKRKTNLILSTLLVFSLILVLTPNSIVLAEELRNEFIVAVPEEPDNIDPHQATTTNNFIEGQLYAPLISMGLENDELLPRLIKEVEASDDLLELKLTFDSDLIYHSGRPITPESYKASLQRRIEISPYGWEWAPLENKYIEDDTLILEFSEVFPGLFITLQSDYDGALDVEAAEEMGDAEFDRAPVGSGPFEFVEWAEGSHIEMRRFDEYRDHLPFVENNGPFHFENYTVRFIPEDFTRVEELRAGNVDLITNIPSEILPSLEEDPDVEMFEYLQESIKYLDINHTRFPFEDRETRLALAYAINRDEIQMGLNDIIEPVFSLVAPAMIRHHAETEEKLSEQYAYNPERAQELLEEAGWEMGDNGVLERDGREFEFELVVNASRPVDFRSAPIIQAQLEQVGINAQIRQYESGYIGELHETGDFNAIFATWNWIDPGGVWLQNLSSGGNYAEWTPTDVDDLVAQATTEPDMERGAELWGEISERIWEDGGIIPLLSPYEYIAYRSNVEGLIFTQNGLPFLNDVKIHDN